MANPTTAAEAPAPRRRRADAERSVAAILDAALEALASDLRHAAVRVAGQRFKPSVEDGGDAALGVSPTFAG
jgi:hypothetical protein